MALPPTIAAAFHQQADASEELGSPFTALLCRLLAERLQPTSRFAHVISTWSDDANNDRLALRAAGGLHALARSGRCPALTAAYPPQQTTPDSLWNAVTAAIEEEDAFLAARLQGPPQTNEVARSNVILGACLVMTEATRLPLEINEIGSSAGLNLAFDQYHYDLGIGTWGKPDAPVHIKSRWEGESPSTKGRIAVVARRGCDIRPLDAKSPDDRETLLSYVWPDQADRLARMEAALAVAASSEWQVEPADAAAWVEKRFKPGPAEGRLRVLIHTIVWSYLPASARHQITASLREAGRHASASAPLAHLSVEPDAVEGSAAIHLTIWPSGEPRFLGRADYHGRWAVN
jgi:hypothetical protein